MFPHRLQRVRGFTLVEILVVVIILGIASAIIIPQIGSRDDLMVSAAARMVMSDMIYAQNRSIATQKPHYVKFDGQQYAIYDEAPLGGAQPIAHPVNKDAYTKTMGSATAGLERVTLDSADFDGKTVVRFDEMGSPYSFDSGNPGATPALVNPGSIILRAGSASLTISVEPYTGETTVN